MHRINRRPRWPPSAAVCMLSGALLCQLHPPAARAAATQLPHHVVPEAVSRLTPVGRLPAAQRLHLAISLPLRNQQALNDLLRQLQDPASPNYRHYLTPAQFTGQFGPTQQDYEAVAAFATARGLSVTYRHSNRLVLDVEGAVSDIEKALHVTMRVYQHPTEGRTFYAPDAEPSPDLPVPISNISGLDNYSLPKPCFRKKSTAQAAVATPNAGSGPGGTYMGNDFRSAYVPGVALTGSGQTVGLLEFDGYAASDITYYENLAELPNVTLTNVLLDNFNGNPSSLNGQTEVSLDIEVGIAMAPGLSQIIVYEAGPYGNFDDILNRMVSDNLAKQLSSSWTVSGKSDDPTADSDFEEMAAQGQSFFQASGDSDAYTGSIPFPADNPYITVVGGTTLTDSGTGGAWSSETAWNWGYDSSAREYVGSSGGVSTQYSIPSWQQGISMTANLGSTTKRNIPDVALTADNVYVRVGGSDDNVGGTSCATPLWAAFTALVNQQAVANDTSTVGFLNPAIYAIATGSGYATDFHDITTGNNFSSSSPSKFPAVTGYDLCTGWGTPAGAALINALAPSPDSLQVSITAFSSSGVAGGPFTPDTNNYTLTNSGSSSLIWIASASQSWLTLSATGGTLAASGSSAITASVNAGASSLASGTHTATITFTDLATGYTVVAQVSLNVIGPPVISSSLTATATDGAAFSYQIAATNNPTSYGAGGLPSGLSVNTSSGLISGTPTATGTSSVAISAINVGGTGTATVTITVLTPPPAITSTLTATAANGGAFSYQIYATNSPTSYGASGLPSGLSVNTETGFISGSTTATGTSSVTIAATNPGGTGSAVLKIIVLPPPPVISSALSGTANNGANFSYHITASNSPTSYGATGLPLGLRVSTSSGHISGSTTATGTSSVTISAINAGGTGSAILTITVLPPPPAINSTLTATAANGAAFSYQITANNSPTSYGASGLPSGLAVNTLNGFISGSTTVTGTTTASITASNAGGSGSAALKITVLPPPPVITSALNTTATNSAAFSYQISAINNPAGYGASGLPAGLSVKISNGLISGTTTATGTTTASIIASNAGGSGSATLIITVLPPPPVITSGTSVTYTQGQPFTYQIVATNSPTSYGASSLPAGLNLDPLLGVISGTASTTGTTSVTISAINAGGTGSASLTVLVLTPYAAWQSQVFTPAELANPAISGDTATPAGDGIPNLMKYALNLNPWTAGVSGLPVESITTTGSGNYLTLTCTQVLSATDITYTVEVSTDLQTWNSGDGYTTKVSAPINPDGVTQSVVVQAAAPAGDNTSKQFIRLKVTNP